MKKSEKQRYEIDPFGRLVSIAPQFREVLDGTFSIDKNNTLTYHLKKTKNSSIPQQLKLTGDWSLDKKHNLVLTLNKENNQRSGDKLTLAAEIINATRDKLEFSMATRDLRGDMHLYLLQLAGTWQADEYNRLSFLVSKKDSSPDILTLNAAWEINKQNQIIYTYTKRNLATKKKATHSITLKGFWEIIEKYRLLYILDKEINSGFEFKVTLGKPLKRGLEYEIGIGSSPKKKKLTLFGSWKISEKLGLLFEMPYEKSKLQRIMFGATCKIDKNSELEFKLKNDLGKDLGINLKFTKDIFQNQGQAFLETAKDKKEMTLRAGVGFRW